MNKKANQKPMEQYNLSKEEARKFLQSADHIIFRSYPLLNDPKLMIKAMDNIFLGITKTMAMILHYEKAGKRVAEFQDNFDSKLELFRNKCMTRYDIEPDCIKFILDVKNIIVQHTKSPVEFVKNDKFIICSNDYDMKTITIDDVKNYLKKAKAFYGRIENILLRGEQKTNKIERMCQND